MKIPKTAEAAVAQLTGLGALVTAKEWERAAIVAALVGPPTGGRGKSGNPDFPYGTVTLAQLGIVGLAHDETVAHYRNAWCKGAGLPAPTLGATVKLPDLDWPPNMNIGRREGMTDEHRETLMQAGRDAGMRTGSKVVDVASNPKAVVAAIKADPRLADAIVKDPDADKAIRQAETRTDASRDTQRSIERGRREREARDDETVKVLRIGSLRGLMGMLDLGGLVGEITTDYQHDEEGAQAARMLAAVLRHEAKVLDAWADGVAVPPTEDEFEREARALLSDPS